MSVIEKQLEDFLDLDTKIPIYDSLEKITYYDEIAPQEKLNQQGEVRIKLRDTDGFALLEKSNFIISIKIDKSAAGHAAFADADLVALSNNGLMHLFSNCSLEIDGQIVEQYSNCGNVTTIMKLLNKQNGFSNTKGLLQCWSVESGKGLAHSNNEGFKPIHDLFLNNNTTKGECTFIVPFNDIFGFGGKIIKNMRVDVILNRIINNVAIFKAASADEARVQITNLTWRIPYLNPNLRTRNFIEKSIESGIKTPFSFTSKNMQYKDMGTATNQSWSLTSIPDKVVGLVLCFVTESRDDQGQNPSIFNNCGLKNCTVILNQDRYPNFDWNLNFANGGYTVLYEKYVDFAKNYFNVDMPEINIEQFKNLYPICVFDLSSQKQRTDPVCHIQIDMNFSTAVAANTTAYALILSEKMMTINFRDKQIEYVH